jgi:dTDP-4-dehydrorhamnose reductase
MSQKPTILITGGSGLLAVNWFYCKRNDFKVYLGLNERKIHPSGSEVLFLDFSSENRFVIQLAAINPSLVIHTAGLTNVETCEKKPELAFYINVELSRIVAKATKYLNIPLVHISTDHLFNGNDSMLSENETYCPVNEYGRTKALAEKYVRDINSESLILRSNFYAWGTSYRKSFSDQIIDSLRKNQIINLFSDVYYTPILANNLINIAHKLIDKKASGIYHVVSDDRVSKYDFGILIAEEFGLDKWLIQKSTLKSKINLVHRPLDMSLSNQKVRELLGCNLGSVKQHIEQLRLQEQKGITKEIQLL